MRIALADVLILLPLTLSSSSAQRLNDDGPLPEFHGRYQMTEAASGSVDIAPALGGAYTEWRVPFEEHDGYELRTRV